MTRRCASFRDPAMQFVRAVEHLNSRAKGSVRRAIQQSDLEGWGLRNVTLRPYQLEGLSWLVERHRRGHGCILGDEMGLGKTVQSISLLVYLCSCKGLCGPFLILCPLSVINNWQIELARFAPQLDVLNYTAGKELREEQREEITAFVSSQGVGWDKAKFPFHVMLSHYEVVIRDSSFMQRFPWQCLIVDEGHRLKNSSSVLYGLLKQFDAEFLLLLTGTPVQNNLKELYCLLSFVAPQIFPTAKRETFVEKFSDLKDEQVATSLHTVLEPFLLRRVKTQVLLDLPQKSEVILYTGLSALQKKYYKAILTKDLAAFGEAGGKTRLMNILVQLRKCVNHPYLFDGVEPEPFELGEHLIEASGKLFLIDQLLTHLKPRGHRVLMFSQMTRMLDIIQDYLGYRGYSYERLDGSVRGEERFLAVRNFSEDEETFVFLLSTRAGGQGLNLAGADTVIFIDSDFNPQNDLQAAARAHRIGQTRPVKVIRLISRHTVEEIVLKRAHTKLELTNTVIEGGQFSHGTVSTVAEKTSQLADILKFGLDTLLQSDESLVPREALGWVRDYVPGPLPLVRSCWAGTIVDEDLESILGRSEGGQWVVEETTQQETKEEEEEEVPENMYVYEGKDYSKSSDADRRTFDQLLAEQLKITEGSLGGRVLRSEHQVTLPTSLPLPEQRKRKLLTPAQLEERRRKREEARAKRMKLLEEQERRKLEEKRRKKLVFWGHHGYTSLNASLESSSSESDSEGSGDELSAGDPSDREIHYVVGDVTRPQNTGDSDAIVVHCVDDSGRWGKGGLFSALSARSPQPQAQYELAGKMKDLSLGDAHMVAIDDLMSRDKGRDMLALIVAQSRAPGGHLSGIKLSALSTGLQRVAREAKRRKASVHLPRIGHATPNFNWYGTERLIRKHLASRGIPSYIYYHPRTKQRADSEAICKHTSVFPTTSGTSTTQASLLPPDCDPLPDIFTGVVVCFHGDSELRRRLSRYIIAYNGDITDTVDSSTTHLVYKKGDSQPPPILPSHCRPVVVSVEWLEACLEQGRQVDTKHYTLATDT